MKRCEAVLSSPLKKDSGGSKPLKAGYEGARELEVWIVTEEDGNDGSDDDDDDDDDVDDVDDDEADDDDDEDDVTIGLSLLTTFNT